MPTLNAERTLERTVRDLPEAGVDDVVLVDDHSTDDTLAVVRRLGLHTVAHSARRGYGGNQKTCYGEALARGAEVCVMSTPPPVRPAGDS